MRISGGDLQRESEGRACAGRTDYIDVLTMGRDDLLCNGKAEAGPCTVKSPGAVGFVKAVPDSRLFRDRNSASVIRYGQIAASVLYSGFETYLGVSFAEFDGIVEQVVDNLLDFFLIGIHEERFTGEDQPDVNSFFAAYAFKNCRISTVSESF